jgi:hypothetical protein
VHATEEKVEAGGANSRQAGGDESLPVAEKLQLAEDAATEFEPRAIDELIEVP